MSEVIELSSPKPWDDLNLLTHLYVKKSYSLRRISRELGCSKSAVRRKLNQAGIEIIQHKSCVDTALAKKVQKLREQGLSFQKIADMLNMWKIKTKSTEGQWHPKTVRRVLLAY